MDRAEMSDFFVSVSGRIMKVDENVISKIEKAVSECGAEFYEAKFFLSGNTEIFRIFADTKDGITLDECANISRKVSDYLDSIDFGKGTYTLEVSSPGIMRLLTSVKDFERVIGKEISVRYRNENDNLRKKTGVLGSVSGEKIVFENGEEIRFSSVLNGKLMFDL
jgi:ribosome maturation factor RimP